MTAAGFRGITYEKTFAFRQPNCRLLNRSLFSVTGNILYHMEDGAKTFRPLFQIGTEPLRPGLS